MGFDHKNGAVPHSESFLARDYSGIFVFCAKHLLFGNFQL